MGNKYGETPAERPKTRRTMEKMAKNLIKHGVESKEAKKMARDAAIRYDKRKGYGTG